MRMRRKMRSRGHYIYLHPPRRLWVSRPLRLRRREERQILLPTVLTVLSSLAALSSHPTSPSPCRSVRDSDRDRDAHRTRTHVTRFHPFSEGIFAALLPRALLPRGKRTRRKRRRRDPLYTTQREGGGMGLAFRCLVLLRNGAVFWEKGDRELVPRGKRDGVG